MIMLVGISFGAYHRLTFPSFAGGIIYLVVQRSLRRSGRRASLVISGVLRIIAGLWFCFLVWTVFSVGIDDPKLYPAKKKLYLAGNYSDSSLLDFMPEKIPDCEGYDAHFTASMMAQDSSGYVNICFVTDSDGIDYLRSQAESRGGEHFAYPPDEKLAETEPYSRLRSYAKFAITDDYSEDADITELYIFGEKSSRHKSCYLLNAETGQVVIHW